MPVRPRLPLATAAGAAVFLALGLFAAAVAVAEPARPGGRWGADLAAFDLADRASRPPPGGVLFLGSSSIRLWSSLQQDFSAAPVVINRGFGGSTMADCHALARQLVLPYRPRQVLVYAGDNDLAEGRTPHEVRDSFAAFVESVRAELPDARIDFIAVKPSPARAHLLPLAREANALVAEWAARVPNTGFIDIFGPMLDAQGAPRAELFSADRLHLNAAGYALWRSVIASYLQPASSLTAAAPTTAAAAAEAATGASEAPAPATPAEIATAVTTASPSGSSTVATPASMTALAAPATAATAAAALPSTTPPHQRP
ncbi:SGNH/GDSL hydrolase family protein [Ramlibacter sp. AN1015]|uniref:SGNH/GDSL hydrolase family protein n=1 Tax=Ramlibacter sp. AN1015 TaxID=3133428 RepID=UPI0030BF0ACE